MDAWKTLPIKEAKSMPTFLEFKDNNLSQEQCYRLQIETLYELVQWELWSFQAYQEVHNARALEEQ
jgi:hypothetical protein